MGCGTISRSRIEDNLSNFINLLIFTEIRDNIYTESIRNAYNNNINSKLKARILTYFKSRRENTYISEIKALQDYVTSLDNSETILLAFSLLFLTRSTSESLRNNFMLLRETFKNEIKFYDNLAELLRLVLTFYVQFVTIVVFNVYKDNRNTPVVENRDEIYLIKEYEDYYNYTSVNDYLKKIFIKYQNNFDLDIFLNDNYSHLNHVSIRDDVKLIWFKSNPMQRVTTVSTNTMQSPSVAVNSISNELVSSERVVEYRTEPVNINLPSNEVRYSVGSYSSNSSSYVPPSSNVNYSTNNYVTNYDGELVSSGRKSTTQGRSSISGNYGFRYSTYDFKLTQSNFLIKKPEFLAELSYDFSSRIRSDACDYHNEFRRLHGADEFSRNSELDSFAQEWAETIASNEKLSYSSKIWKGLPVGENVTLSDYENFDIRTILRSWYDQKNSYNLSLNENQSNTESFSQIVWRNSREIGVGIAKSQSGKVYFVVNYFPAGNVRNEFIENVRPSN